MSKTIIWLASNLSATKDLMDNTFTDLWSIGAESLVALIGNKDNSEDIKSLNEFVKDSIVMSLARRFPLEAVSQLMDEKNFSINTAADGSRIFSSRKEKNINFDPGIITELQSIFNLPDEKFDDLYIALDICSLPVDEAAQIYYSLRQAINDRAILYVSSTKSTQLAQKWINRYNALYKEGSRKEKIVMYNRYGVAVTPIDNYTDCLLVSAISAQK